MQSRAWNLASLNEFREYFKLAPHKTFESINPDPKVAKALQKLYGHPDNVEIYPGIVVEGAKKSISPGSGLCASWTTSRAILADAVALVRGDRFYTVDYTPTHLTNWGFQTASYDVDINHGGVFYKLVLNAFPNHFSKNSVYAHFPLVNSGENKKLLAGMGREQLYDFDPPQWKDKIACSPVNGTSTKTDTLLVDRAAQLGADKEAVAGGDHNLLFSEAILSNEKWKAIVTKFYAKHLADFWEKEKYELGGYQEVDVVSEVLNAAHAKFILWLLDIPIQHESNPDEPDPLVPTLSNIFEAAHTAQPRGLASAVREAAHWFAGLVESAFGAGAQDSDLGAAAFAKMKKVNGTDAKQTAWRDVMPMAALMLTHLCRSSAAAVEAAIPDKQLKKQTECVSINHATNDGPKAGDSHLGSDMRLSQEVAEIAKKAIEDIVSKHASIDRSPGAAGRIKKITVGQETKYLNATLSDYVAFPRSLKLRWK